MLIMILNREDSALRGSRAFQEGGSIDRHDTIEINDPHGDARFLEPIIGFQGLEQRDAGRHNRQLIGLALPNYFGAADREGFLVAVQNRRLGPAGPDIDWPSMGSSGFDQPIGTDSIGWV